MILKRNHISLIKNALWLPKNLATTAFTATLVITTITLMATTAQAIVFDFEATRSGGYSAKESFSYDENLAPNEFLESGSGETNI